MPSRRSAFALGRTPTPGPECWHGASTLAGNVVSAFAPWRRPTLSVDCAIEGVCRREIAWATPATVAQARGQDTVADLDAETSLVVWCVPQVSWRDLGQLKGA